MPPKLAPFQQKLEHDIYEAWAAGATNVMPVAATGSGKTVVASKLLADEPGPSIAIAHRQELISQIATALARNGVRHRIVGAKKGSPLTKIITMVQVAELGYSFIDPNAKTGVGGIDTIVRMQNEPWFKTVRLQMQDEGHHVLKDNKWGRGALMFPNARAIFPTATPKRADGKGLGRHSHGLADALVLAPSMRDLINSGYLTDYKVYAPRTADLDLSNVEISKATGDFNKDQTRAAVHKSSIVGDIVGHYKRLAMGKLGVTFCVDVEEATKTAQQFRENGVTAEVVTGDTDTVLRTRILGRFKNREIMQLVNVDLFGEGFDLPTLEAVSFGRPTESFALYSQQFGRALRLMIPPELRKLWDNFTDQQRLELIASSGKPYGIIIDHVGNVLRHLLPDQRQDWSLDPREFRKRKKADDGIPLKVCTGCLQPYERTHRECPYCGFYMPPAGRSLPEYVDGDLHELDAATLSALRKEIARKEGDFHPPANMDWTVQAAARRNWMDRQQAQNDLKNAIAWWAGLQHGRGFSETDSYRRFFFKFGIDVANAQLLGAPEARELCNKVQIELTKFDIDGTVSAGIYFDK